MHTLTHADEARIAALAVSDATEFINGNDAATIAQCLRPGQEQPDYALINALGLRGTAKYFSVENPDSEEFRHACDVYNRAWIEVLVLDTTKPAYELHGGVPSTVTPLSATVEIGAIKEALREAAKGDHSENVGYYRVIRTADGECVNSFTVDR